MSQGEDEVKVKFDLDTKEAIDSLMKLKNSATSLGESAGPEALISGLTSIGAVAGTVGLAIFAIKKSIDLVVEGEGINKINKQFETLAMNAGLAGNALKEGLVKAAGGMIDDTDLLKAANKSIIEMGSNASKLPQILELARKATKVMGGDAVQNFEAISQAIATGSTRALKNMGIIVDSERALKDYANATGQAVGELTQFGKQQALMNAVLAKGNEAFGDVKAGGESAGGAIKEMSVIMENLKEAFILTFEKVAGPTVRSFLGSMKNMAKDFKTFIASNFGEGLEQAEASVERFGVKIKEVEEKIKLLEKNPFSKNPWGSQAAEIDRLKSKLIEYQKVVDDNQVKVDEFKAKNEQADAEASLKKADTQTTDNLKYIENERKFQQDILALRMQAVASQMQMATDVDVYEDLRKQRKLILEEEYQNQVKQIRENMKGHAAATDAAVSAAYADHIAKMKALDQDLDSQHKKVWDNYQKQSGSAMDQVGRGFRSRMEQDRLQMNDFGALGAGVYDSFKTHATNAFVAVGEGSKSMGDAMRDMVLGVISDEAIARGSVMMMTGIFPPNPVQIGAGAALVAFGGFLKSKISGHGGSSVSSASSAGGSASSMVQETVKDDSDAKQKARDDAEAQRKALAEEDKRKADMAEREKQDRMAREEQMNTSRFEQQKKTTNLIIQGSLYETEQTRERLVSMIREANDSSNFTIQSVGGGI